MTDINYVEYVCESRSGEGLGYSNIGTTLPLQNTTNATAPIDIISGLSPNGTLGQYPIRTSSASNGFVPTAALTLGCGTIGASSFNAQDITSANDL